MAVDGADRWPSALRDVRTAAEAARGDFGRSRGPVIGCVWGAYRQLVEKLGPDCAPDYVWCEKEWRAAPQGQLPPVGSKALPDALTRYLEDLWQTRGQPSLF